MIFTYGSQKSSGQLRAQTSRLNVAEQMTYETAEYSDSFDVTQNESSNDTQLQSSEDIALRSLTVFLYWFTIVAVSSGCLISISNVLFAWWCRRNLIFLPHLLVIVFGNWLFLSLIGVNLIAKEFVENQLTAGYCVFLLYSMGVLRQLPTLSLLSISIEQTIGICFNQYRKIKISERRNIITTVFVFATSLLANLWVIPIAKISDGTHCLLMLPPSPHFMRTFRLSCLLVVDFCPVLLMIVCHSWLIAKITCGTQYHSFICRYAYTPTERHSLSLRRARMSYARKRSILQLVGLATTLSLFNFPNILQNVLDQTIDTFGDGSLVFSTLAYVLFHLQYIAAALYIRLPLFRKRTPHTSGQEPEMSQLDPVRHRFSS